MVKKHALQGIRVVHLLTRLEALCCSHNVEAAACPARNQPLTLHVHLLRLEYVRHLAKLPLLELAERVPALHANVAAGRQS